MTIITVSIPPSHDRVLEAVTVNGETCSINRFEPVLQALKKTINPMLQLSCLQFINAIVNTPDDIDFKLHLRNEFMRGGLEDVLVVIKLFTHWDNLSTLYVYPSIYTRPTEGIFVVWFNPVLRMLLIESMLSSYLLIESILSSYLVSTCSHTVGSLLILVIRYVIPSPRIYARYNCTTSPFIWTSLKTIERMTLRKLCIDSLTHKLNSNILSVWKMSSVCML